MITRLTALPPAGVTRGIAGVNRFSSGVLRSDLFAPLSLSPSIFSEAGVDMLKVGAVTAEYLDAIPNLVNRGTGSDSLQAVAASQPTALPLIGGSGYLHLPGVSGNYPSVPDAADLDGFGDFTLQIDDVTLSDWTPSSLGCLIAKEIYTGGERSFFLGVHTGGSLRLQLSFDGVATSSYFSTASTGLTSGATASFRAVRTGSDIDFFMDTGSGFSALGSTVVGVATTVFASTSEVSFGSTNGGGANLLNGSIGRARIWSDATQTTNVLDIDFSLAAHKATSFTATTGQTVTINQSGDDPADIIGRPVMRLDGVDDYLAGTFASALTAGGTMFLVASVLGAGGEANARLLSTWVTTDTLIDAFMFSYRTSAVLQSYNNADLLSHTGGYSGRFLHEVSASDLDSTSRINNAGEQTSAKDLSAVASTDFAIGGSNTGASNPAIDLEMLLFYPRKLTASESSNVRGWIATNYATH